MTPQPAQSGFVWPSRNWWLRPSLCVCPKDAHRPGLKFCPLYRDCGYR